MKNKIYSLLAALICLVAFTGCDDWNPADGRFPANTGGVSLSSMAVSVNQNASSVTSRAGVDTSGYLVTITGTDGSTVVYDGKECSWTFGEMPEVITLPVADGYTVNVRSHEPEMAAWEAPYFEGSKTFDVKNGEITAIGTVKCLFAGVKVLVKYADDLAAAMSTDSKVDVKAGTDGLLTWSATETRHGHFKAVEGSNTLVATFTGKVKGQDVTKIKEFTDLEKGKYYIITFSMKSGNSNVPDEFGNINPGGITVDTSVEEKDENGNVDINQDPANPDKRPDDEDWPDDPTPPGPGPDEPEPGTDVIDVKCPTMPDFDKVYPSTLESYTLNITSENPLTHLHVQIVSDYLTAEFLEGVGLTDKFDLAEPGDLDPALKGFGFPTGNEVIGAKELTFELTSLIPLLDLGKNEGVYEHQFKLTIEDNAGNSKTVELKIDTRL
ncbi:MAG: DUF4493 domain-containing protein [Muribaculaceae bacterium]|nr:DUF4493 domain-containing protein [Muribaculaceae bacterium]